MNRHKSSPTQFDPPRLERPRYKPPIFTQEDSLSTLERDEETGSFRKPLRSRVEKRIPLLERFQLGMLGPSVTNRLRGAW